MSDEGPQDASIRGKGNFRFYSWPGGDSDLHRKYNATERTDVLSVTSIRSLCGMGFQLVNWQQANLIDAAMGTMKRTVIGPRGGVKEKRVLDIFPSEFVQKYLAGEGSQASLDEIRGWLRDTADAPRNIAARRGTIVHKAIEQGVGSLRIERPYVESVFETLSSRDRKNANVTDEDVDFVYNAVRQYEDMRANVPFVILAREPQVWNLTAGYAGSTDVLMWFLPEGSGGTIEWQARADRGAVTVDDIRRFGGRVVLGDWKTSKDVQTDHVVQITAYTIAEFVGRGGVIDERLTEILSVIQHGALVHIRPNKWAVDFTNLEPEVVRAFLGQCAIARFLAKHPKPGALFTDTLEGVASETDESEFLDDDTD